MSNRRRIGPKTLARRLGAGTLAAGLMLGMAPGVASATTAGPSGSMATTSSTGSVPGEVSMYVWTRHPTSVHLDWHSAPGPGVTTYEVKVDGQTYTTTADDLWVKGLQPDTPYEVSIRAVNEHGPGPSTVLQIRTAGPPMSPQDVRAKPLKGGTRVYYAPPADDWGAAETTVNVQIDGTTHVDDVTYWRDSKPAGGLPNVPYGSVVIEGLEEGQSYEATVWLENKYGTSEPTTVTVTAATAPGVVENLAATATHDSVTAQWEEPTTLSNAGQSYYVDLYLKDASGKVVARVDRTRGTQATFTGLQPDSEYTLLARTYNHQNMSSTSTVTVTTAPAPVVVEPVPPTSPTPPVEAPMTPAVPATPAAPATPAKAPTAPAKSPAKPPAKAPAKAPAKKAKADVKAVSKGSKLKVDVNPDRSKGSWSFTVQRKQPDGSWKSMKTYATKGKAETKTVNLSKGTYRVVVHGKDGYASSTSAEVTLKR